MFIVVSVGLTSPDLSTDNSLLLVEDVVATVLSEPDVLDVVESSVVVEEVSLLFEVVDSVELEFFSVVSCNNLCDVGLVQLKTSLYSKYELDWLGSI